MIYPYVGDFLISPIPLQLSFNWCSHACSYCFANLNNPKRSFDLKEFQTQLKGIYSRNDLQSVLLREKYPVLISNLVDPFATSNYGVSIPVIELLNQMGIPVAIQTRGGRGTEHVLSYLPKSVWYISIPMLRDEIRKQIEPAAPSIESRLNLIDELIAKGHRVLVGINPTVSDWLPENDGYKLLDTLKAKGVHGIWVAALHFNSRQIKVMPEKDRGRIGELVVNKGLKNARDLQKDCFDFIDNLKEYAVGIGLEVEGMFDGETNHFFSPFYSAYNKAFPTIYNFINWCHKNKGKNEPVYYQEFENVMLPGLVSGEHNISPYMRCMSQKLDEEVRREEGYKQSFRWLLQLCWNEPRMKRQLIRYWTFAQSVSYSHNKMIANVDKEGYVIYHFNKDTYQDEYFITN